MEQNIFTVGQAAHYQVGSDRYDLTVTKVTPARVTATRGSETIVFTKRGNGVFKVAGWDRTGTLRHGHDAYTDPSF